MSRSRSLATCWPESNNSGLVSSSDRVPVQQRRDLHRVRSFESLPGVVDQHPVGAPVVLSCLERPPAVLADLHALDIAGAAQVFYCEREPVVCGPGVHFERHVLARVRARHPLVQDVVEPDVAQSAVLAVGGHGGDGGAAEVEGGLVGAAVGATWAQVRDDDPRGRGLAARVGAFHVVALAAPLAVLEDGRVACSNLVPDGGAC